MAVLNDVICNDCGTGAEDRFNDEPCINCGSVNVSPTRNRTQLAISVGTIEPTRMIDHATGESVLVTSMAEAKRLADNYAISRGYEPGTFMPYIRTSEEHRSKKNANRQEIIAAQLRLGIEPSNF